MSLATTPLPHVRWAYRYNTGVPPGESSRAKYSSLADHPAGLIRVLGGPEKEREKEKRKKRRKKRKKKEKKKGKNKEK
jgi:hypothetical protein